MDLKIGNIPIVIGSIPHRVAFSNFEEAAEGSNVVALPEVLQEKLPKLPGVLKGTKPLNLAYF